MPWEFISSTLGECWGNYNKLKDSAELYQKYGASTNCYNLQYTDSGDKPQRCGTYVGKNHANYIYRIRNNSRKLSIIDDLGRETKQLLVLRKTPRFHPISWCENFVERCSFRRVSGGSRKQGPSTKFPHQEIR